MPAREPSQTLRFAGRDGLGLYGEFFAAERPRAVALRVHGYGEQAGRYREVADVLVNDGLACLSFDQRGHGRAEGQRGYVERFTDYVGDLEAALDELDRLCPGDRPRVLVCHSNGSLIALRWLADPGRPPERVVGAVMSSPFLALQAELSPGKQLAARLVGRILPTLTLAGGLRVEHLTHDPDKLAERRIDTLCHDVASARWYLETVQTQAWVREFIGKMTVPTLWLVSGQDRIADPRVTRAVHARVRAPSQYREFPEMHHEVFNELGRDRVFGLVRQFLRDCVPG